MLVPDNPRVTTFGERVHAKPVAGEITLLSETVPVNPLSEVNTIVEGADVPAFAVTLVGDEVIVKS